MNTMKYVLAGFILFIATGVVSAQDGDPCINKYNFFKGDYQTKRYAEAKVNLDWLLENCPTLSVNIYKLGNKIGEKTKDAALVQKIYTLRLQYFPTKDAAKAHSDYATYLTKNNLGTDAAIFSILEKAYSINPIKLSVKNMYKYFQGVVDAYKETDPQRVFDTYDDVMESVGEKLEDYTKKRKPLQDRQAAGETLGSKDAKRLRAYTINSKALGQVEGGLDNIISEIATCERLIPLYERDFDKNKTNPQWLKRSVSRMHNKGCQDAPLYESLARAYAEASPSADAYVFLAGILAKNGNASGASEMRNKAFDLETDPFKKAKYKLKFAQIASKSGRKSKARSLAREALSFNPNLGKAYLFIASLYASSANTCGTNEFEKRMVYVAALSKARRAVAVDPSISRMASKHVRSYKSNIPSKKLIFTQGVAPGSTHKISCWIGETVRVPQH